MPSFQSIHKATLVGFLFIALGWLAMYKIHQLQILFLPVAMLFIGFFENTQNAYFTSIYINAVIYGTLTYIISKQVRQRKKKYEDSSF